MVPGSAGEDACMQGIMCWWALQDYVVERLQRIEGVRVASPDGAFYVLPDLSAFFGPDVHADDFGPIPDADTLCRCHSILMDSLTSPPQ